MAIGVEYNPWIDDIMPYRPGKPIEELARELGVSPEQIIKMASNENALGPSPRAVEALRAAAGRMHLYPDGSCYYLGRALAARLGVAVEQLVFGTGSNELLVLLAQAFLGPGRNAVMSDRSFLIYRLVTRLVGAVPVEVPMRDWTTDLAAMRGAITDDTRLVFVANPNNPTGTAVGAAELESFVDDLPPGVLAVVDEAYVEFMPPEWQPRLVDRIRRGARLCCLRTFSKLYGLAGLRIGYAITSAEVASLLHRVRQPFNVNAAAQAAALAALDDEEHVHRTLRLVREEMVFLEKAFDRLGLEYVPSLTNFILVRVGNGKVVFKELLSRHIIVRPMDAYGLPEYVRITIGTRDQNERLVEALETAVKGGREL